MKITEETGGISSSCIYQFPSTLLIEGWSVKNIWHTELLFSRFPLALAFFARELYYFMLLKVQIRNKKLAMFSLFSKGSTNMLKLQKATWATLVQLMIWVEGNYFISCEIDSFLKLMSEWPVFTWDQNFCLSMVLSWTLGFHCPSFGQELEDLVATWRVNLHQLGLLQLFLQYRRGQRTQNIQNLYCIITSASLSSLRHNPRTLWRLSTTAGPSSEVC